MLGFSCLILKYHSQIWSVTLSKLQIVLLFRRFQGMQVKIVFLKLPTKFCYFRSHVTLICMTPMTLSWLDILSSWTYLTLPLDTYVIRFNFYCRIADFSSINDFYLEFQLDFFCKWIQYIKTCLCSLAPNFGMFCFCCQMNQSWQPRTLVSENKYLRCVWWSPFERF